MFENGQNFLDGLYLVLSAIVGAIATAFYRIKRVRTTSESEISEVSEHKLIRKLNTLEIDLDANVEKVESLRTTVKKIQATMAAEISAESRAKKAAEKESINNLSPETIAALVNSGHIKPMGGTAQAQPPAFPAGAPPNTQIDGKGFFG